MIDSESPPGIGQIVRIRKGRDLGSYAVVIEWIDKQFLFLADGEKRKFDRPKKKNVNHLEPLPYISDEVKRSIEETGRVTNAKLRYAIFACLEELAK